MVHNFMLHLSTTAPTLEEEICEYVSRGVNSSLGCFGVLGGFGGWGVFSFVCCLVWEGLFCWWFGGILLTQKSLNNPCHM